MIIKTKIEEAIQNLNLLKEDAQTLQSIQTISDWIISAIESGNKLMICGNGGSAADSQHMAGEFLCRFYQNRIPLPAIALTTDTSTLTAISNDFAYEVVFSRQIKALGKPNDVLLGISTSGSSKNVLMAFQTAKEIGIRTVLLTGSFDREIAKFSDLVIKVPSKDTPRIQEMHLLIEHIISELVERSIFAGEK